MKLLEKLVSPRNNWDMKSPDSWWPFLGSVPTVTGKRVSEDSALRFSAVCAATRIISETLASLPLNTLQQVDSRTTNKATDHPLYKILHDIPNPEQDSMTFFDQQTAFTVNWGNSYAEVQRGFGNEITALWPIHPSRIPLKNITRNSSWREATVGQPGELVYWVKNDDGSVTPIPKSDMLHVPGVLSSNGITGQSVVQLAANSIGIGLATEEHAGALFKNGAVSNIALTSLKAIGKDRADYLRAQWQQTFGGVQNHYKTLLLEDGITPVPINMNPEQTQLILARQFSVTEIARWYRLPPHLLADLSRSTFSNIEAENLSFVVHSMLPWIVRWEKALYRQLLTPEEQGTYRFKFNVNGLLRGDTAARAQFYQVMFNLGAFSPNDIRAREDENPIDGGDQYFVQGNNAVPLDKVGELADAQIEKAKQPPPASNPQTAPKPDPNADNHARLVELRKLQEEFILKFELRDAPRDVVEKISLKLDEIRENTPKLADFERISTAAADGITKGLQPTIEAMADAGAQLVTRQATHFAEQVAAIPAEVAKLVPPPAPPVDTSEFEKIAVREAEIATKQAEIDKKQAEITQKMADERKTTDEALALTLKRGIDSLANWEAKALLGARENPREFVKWRNEFYPRFLKRFQHELGEFVDVFLSVGVAIDLDWGANSYARRSIDDLKTLDVACSDNHYDAVKTTTDHFVKSDWADRSATLAAEMIERGRKKFDERKEKTCDT